MRLAARARTVFLMGMVLVGGAETQEKEAPEKPEKEVSEESAWPTFHGGYGLTGVADARLPDRPVRVFRFKAGHRIDAPPVAADGGIYFTASGGRIFALDRRGRKIWNVVITEDTFSSPPLYAGRMVVVGARSGRLLAFEAATGREKWRYDVGGPILGTANRVDLEGDRTGVIVISQADGAVHCVDLATGKSEWRTGEVDRCDGSASVGGGRIVMGSCASALHVFSVKKAEKTADIPLGKDCQVAGGVALSGKLAFAGTRSGHVCAVDVTAGKIVWTNRDSKSETFTTPAVNDRYVFFGSDDGKVYCVKRATGVKIWSYDTDDVPSSPVIAGRRVVVSSGGVLFLLDLESGRKIWSDRVSDWITSPAVAFGMVIVGADDGTVTAYGRRK